MNNQNNQPQEELSSLEGIVDLEGEQLENVIGAGGAFGKLAQKCVSCVNPKTNEGGLQMQFHYQKLDPQIKTLLHQDVKVPALEGAPSSSPSTTSEQKTAYAREFNPFTGSKVQPHSPTK
jgi:hypothetical protein